MFHISVVCIILVHIPGVLMFEYTQSGEARLNRDMIARMSLENMREALPMVRPAYDTSKPVNVSVIFQLKQILDFDEKNQIVTAFFLRKYQWYNYLMTWRPEEYDGVTRMRYPKKEVWVPDVILYYGVATQFPDKESTTHVTVQNDGTVTLFQPIIYTIPCLVDMFEFPYDIQHCEMEWGSWEYITEDMDMQHEGEEMDLSEYLGNQEWKLLPNTSAEMFYYHEEDGIYATLTYYFSIKRNPIFYFKMILIPTVLLSFLMFTVFWIPPTRPDRSVVAVGVFSGFMLLLLLVVSIAPPATGIKLGLYYCTNIVLVVFSIVFSGTVVPIASKECEMGSRMRRILVEKIGVTIGIYRQYDYMMRFNLVDVFTSGTTDLLNKDKAVFVRHQEVNMDQLDLARRKRLECRRDWQVAAVVLDRIVFCIFVLTTLVCMGVYLPWPTDVDFLF